MRVTDEFLESVEGDKDWQLVSRLSGKPCKTIKARELSGANNLLFRRNSVTGAVEVVKRDGSGITLNEALHAN